MQYLLCQWDHTLCLTCWEKKTNSWVCNDGETIHSWEKICRHLQTSSDILTETKDLHFTIYVPYVQQKKRDLCVHWLVSLAQAVTTVSHSMFLFPYFGTSLTVLSCVWDLKLAALLAKLPFWLDIVRTLAQRRGFSDHLTSLINKSSIAK